MRPSFKAEVEIPAPTFQLNPNQQPYGSAGEKDREQEKRESKPAHKPSSGKSGKSAYGSMFVKGGSEFVKEKAESTTTTSVAMETEWPEG